MKTIIQRFNVRLWCPLVRNLLFFYAVWVDFLRSFFCEWHFSNLGYINQILKQLNNGK